MQGLVAGLTLSERFHLIRQLGVGGMGEIWLAEDEQLGERVALKILNPTFAQSEDFIDLLRDECRKARALVHPNIVRVFDFHIEDPLFFISMQHIEGQTLAAFRGKSFQEIVRFLLMVCDALEYAHRAEIIHRDLKPSNIMVDQNGVCYLTDFGISAALSDDRQLSVPRGGGSLPAMSPQQLSHEPATIADDIYSLGALLYELLSGQPLFHPGVTEQRILAELPKAVLTDGQGQDIPESLGKLVLAMLEKTAERRPAGVGAVRLVLEEVAADYPLQRESSQGVAVQDAAHSGVIKPVRRRASAADNRAAEQVAGSYPGIPKEKKGLPASFVYGGLAALVLVAFGVVFLLPEVVEERGPLVIDSDATAKSEEEVTARPGDGLDPAASEAQRKFADEVLGELLEIEDQLKSIGVELWGGSDWTESSRAVDNGDNAYRGRDFAGAAENYQRALTLMKLLETQGPGVLATALEDGKTAFDVGDQMRAIQLFELALAIEPKNKTAQAGLERARNLDQVIELMSRAAAFEESGDLDGARSAYNQVLNLDALWQRAQDGLARISAGISRNVYEVQMAAGFSAMAQENFARARAAFTAALAVRPGDTDATSALRQLSAEEQMRNITVLKQDAVAAEQAENWAAAVRKYSEILSINGQLAQIKDDRARSQRRLELHEQMNLEINRSERFNEDPIWSGARQLLDRARSISEPGAVLSAQIEQLDNLLRIASVPVPVQFRSDNLTDVVIYKVGSLGTFLNRTVDLKPGAYTAVGTRDGYRDVRQNFTVETSGNMSPIFLSCEDTI